MTAPRLILALAALAFLGFGIAFLVSPAAMGALVELDLTSATARTEVRAMYGGLEIGLGVGLLTLLFRHRQVALGLRVALAAFVGLAAGRLYGLAVDGWWQPIMWLLTAVEVLAAGLCWWAIHAVRAAEETPREGEEAPPPPKTLPPTPSEASQR
jgi:Flp pilus assembly protein TadB